MNWYIFSSITPTNLGKLSKPGTVLESASLEDSKTVPESLIDLAEIIKVKDNKSISKKCLILDFVFDLH